MLEWSSYKNITLEVLSKRHSSKDSKENGSFWNPPEMTNLKSKYFSPPYLFKLSNVRKSRSFSHINITYFYFIFFALNFSPVVSAQLYNFVFGGNAFYMQCLWKVVNIK